MPNEVEVEEKLAGEPSQDPIVDPRAEASDPALRVLTSLTAAAAIKFAAIGPADHTLPRASATTSGHAAPVIACGARAQTCPNPLPSCFTLGKTGDTRDVTRSIRHVEGVEPDLLPLPFIHASWVRPGR